MLNPKQRLFVKEYLKDKNATRSAKAAGYSKKTAHSIGPRLLENVEVRKAIDAGLDRLMQKADITAERVLNEIATVAFQKLSSKENKVMSGNKLRALELLGKNKKLFTDVTEQKTEATVTVVDERAVKEMVSKLEGDV